MRSTRGTINFNAGPAPLPKEVLEQASHAIVDYNGTGLSILEIPHRGKHFDTILEESKALVRELCALNADQEVLWMHGGGRMQFCMVPMNFLGKEETAGFIDSGYWATQAIEYANFYGNVHVLASGKENGYQTIPEWPAVPKDLAYLHITTNNTIFGTQLQNIPYTNVPLVADMSSDILSRKIDYTQFDMFYACAQKNIGPAGVTLAVVNKKMLQDKKRDIPPMLSYTEHVKKNSVLNTPPVFAIYTSLLTLRWIKQKGIEQIEQENNAKAAMLYDEIERNALFNCTVNKNDRSKMNVCFHARDKEVEQAFVTYSEAQGIVGIGGHWSAGAFRASLYNAITIDDVTQLVATMKDFEQTFAGK
ncbi:MAG: 3-phosphoserine/phosphohydroxythreonine transaminase [Sphingobacteriales bacterium]|nr:MAG: 3-phosphoserine/phosphohydroxythreonine transaminase [Sphingobacteriales bacterium]